MDSVSICPRGKIKEYRTEIDASTPSHTAIPEQYTPDWDTKMIESAQNAFDSLPQPLNGVRSYYGHPPHQDDGSAIVGRSWQAGRPDMKQSVHVAKDGQVICVLVHSW
jgi:hypothetical protein